MTRSALDRAPRLNHRRGRRVDHLVLAHDESDHERDENFAELRDWVGAVLRAQYPDYLADRIRPCWPNHPQARWELAWLYHLWSAAYWPCGAHLETQRTGTTAGHPVLFNACRDCSPSAAKAAAGSRLVIDEPCTRCAHHLAEQRRR